jgi:hypothetical protein
MQFTIVKNAIVALLRANAGGLFQVMHSGPQRLDVDLIAGTDKRLVVVEYEHGEFPDTVNSIDGGHIHDATYRIELLVSSAAQVDLATLDTTTDPAARAAALAAAIDPIDQADADWDSLYSLIWGILMAPQNDDLGLGLGIIANRKVIDAQKGNAIPEGDRVTLGGFLHFQVRMVETPVGETGTPADEQGLGYSLDTVINATSDVTGAGMDSAEQGVKAGT